MLNKFYLIAACTGLSAVVLTGAIFFISSPVLIINEEVYNKNKLNELSIQRESEYNELFILLHNEITDIVLSNQIETKINNALINFYDKSILIDEKYINLMDECRNNVNFPLQNISRKLLNEVFPSYIKTVHYSNQYYDVFTLNLLLEHYDILAKNITNEKTAVLKQYIEYNINLQGISFNNDYNFLNTSFNENILDAILGQCVIEISIIEKASVKVSDVFSSDIPVTMINGGIYSMEAVIELQNSMKIISEYLLGSVRHILRNGVDYQTEIYLTNIENYISWYNSLYTGIERTITNIISLFSASASSQEMFYTGNFNRIMNANAGMEDILKSDLLVIKRIINELYSEFYNILKCFNMDAKFIFTGEIKTEDTQDSFISPYISDITLYFGHIFEALENANSYFYQDYVNNTELKRNLTNKMIENQYLKKQLINDPFNFPADRIVPGSVLFVDNYFIGFSTYQHYGIYLGNERVIHFAPVEGQEFNILNLQESFRNAVIHVSSLDDFLGARALQIDRNIEKRFSDQEIIQRAMSKLGQKEYDLFTNNCEHFARWCVTGDHISYQAANVPEKLNDIYLFFQESRNTLMKFFDLFN